MIQFKLTKTLYGRNLKKNRLMVIFMLITNLLLGTFVLFLDADKAVLPLLSQSYLEHLSVGISAFDTFSTNNELMNVRMHRRPPLSLLSSMMNHVGYFEVRPDYSLIFEKAELSIFDKTIENPLFAIHGLKTNEIGVNRAFYDIITKAVQPNPELRLNLNIAFSLRVEETDVAIEINEELLITYITEEPPFFLSPKIYLPQSFIDERIGTYPLFSNLTMNDYLLNIPNDHPASGYRFLCHLESVEQKERLRSLLKDISNDKEGYDLTSDEISKVESIKVMFSYINLLVSIFLVLIIIGCAVVYITIVHTSFLSSMKQMALLNVWGAKKINLYFLFIKIVIFNYFLGACSFFLFPALINIANVVVARFLHIPLFLTLNTNRLILLAGAQLTFLVFLYSVVFYVNNKRPLLYLLIDA